MYRSELTFGYIVLLIGIIGSLLGFPTEYKLFRLGIVGLFLIVAVYFLARSMPFSALWCFLEAVGSIVGFQLQGRWGMLVGLVIANFMCMRLIDIDYINKAQKSLNKKTDQNKVSSSRSD
jgi:hypothetical protein